MPVPIPPHRPYRRLTEDARLRIIRLSAEAGRPLNETLRIITRIAADTLGVERASVWLFTEDRTAVRCVCLFERTSGRHTDGLTLRVADFPDYFAAVAERRAIPAENALVDPRTAGLKRAYLDPLGITSLLDASIYVHGQIVGIACHEHVGPPREWTTEERDFAANVADLIALKMKGAELDDMKSKPISSDSVLGRRGDEPIAHFCAGLSHDLRNLLTIVLGNADLIANDLSAPPSLREKAKHILSAADRGIALANEFSEIGGKRAGRPRILCPSEEIQNLLPVLRSAVDGKHPIVFRNQSRGDRIFADPVQLERILVNLILNARDAMPDGGPIDIMVLDGASQVEITVADHGIGIDPATKHRIFDPYFTTKPKGKGSGIGLTVVRRMVELLGGTIEIDSSVGSGTTVRVSIPRAGSPS